MDWQEPKNNFSMAFVESGHPIEDAMTDFCRHIKEHVIPKNVEVPWDCLRIELWADSGRMIAFPASTSRPDRIEKAGCQVIFGDLLAEYERLADSNLADVDFTASLIRMERVWAERFLEAARQVSLTGIRVQLWDSGEELLCDEQV